jgi:hypothetical protein
MHFGNSLMGAVSGEDIWQVWVGNTHSRSSAVWLTLSERYTSHRARSTIDAIEELGRTVWIAYRMLETHDIYQAIPKLISTVITDASEIDDCVHYGRPMRIWMDKFERGEARRLTAEEMTQWEIASEAIDEQSQWGFKVMENQKEVERGGCVRRDDYPEGIPIWKMFA